MKPKFFLPIVISILFMAACSSNSNTTENVSPGVNDTTSTNPVSNAMDYHADQRQQIPRPDSSNTIGTDTISGTTATPNTGTDKLYNTQKGDSSNKH